MGWNFPGGVKRSRTILGRGPSPCAAQPEQGHERASLVEKQEFREMVGGSQGTLGRALAGEYSVLNDAGTRFQVVC